MFNKKNISIILFPLLLVLFSVVSHLPWLNSANILTNGDVWFLYKESMLVSNWGTWISHLSFGEVNISYNLFLLTFMWQVIAKLGFNYQIANQLIYFSIIIFVTPIGMYFCLKQMNCNKIASFTGTILYMFTTFFLMMQTGGLLLATAYALIPVQFLFLDRYIQKQKKTDGLFLILIISLAIFYELRIVYISLFVFIFYTLFFFGEKYGKSFFPKLLTFIVKSLPLIILFFIINAYTYLPLLFTSVKDAAGAVAARGLFGESFFTLKNPLVLMHPFWSGKVPGEFIVQPVPFYFWIFPLVAFASLFFVHKNKKILFFAAVALVMVFLGKSAADPFGTIYTWLYYNFPGFGFFREPSKFWAMMAFSYAILTAYTLHYSFLIIDKHASVRKIHFFLKLLLVLPIICVSLYVGKPAFTSELGQLFTNLFIPDDHIYTKDFFFKQKDYFRTYYVPGRYRMGFWSEIHPMLGLNEVVPQLQTLNPAILSMLSVKYVVVPPDITNDVYRIWGSKEVYKRSVENAPGLTKLTDPHFGNFSVYENTIPPKPHIYTDRNMIYVSGPNTTLARLFPLFGITQPLVYFENTGFTYDKEVMREIKEVNNMNYEASNEVFLTTSCVRCERRNYLEGLIYPNAKIAPDSPLYKYIRYKEEKYLNLPVIKNDVYTHLFAIDIYSVKRALEIQRIWDTKLGQDAITAALYEHKKMLDILEGDVESLDTSKVSNDSLLKINDYLIVQLNAISGLSMKNDISDKNIELLKKNHQKLIVLSQKLAQEMWLSDGNNDRYLLQVTYPDTYQAYIEGAPAEQSVTINDTTTKLKDSDTKGWSSAGNYTLPSGENRITLQGRKVNLVSSTSQYTKVNRGVGMQTISIPINAIESKKDYLVAFNYKITDNSNVKFFISRDTDFDQNGFSTRTLNQFLNSDGDWHAVNESFSSRFGEKKSVLTFVVYKDKNRDIEINLTDIRVIKNTSPLVVFKKTKPVESITYQPSVAFQWINPTKYIVNIVNAKSPFYLVMSESFHPSWEAYDMSDGGKKIAKHFEVNGYANAWYVDKTGNFALTVEFAPQRIFYLSLWIAGGGVLVALVWLLILKLKH